MLCKRGAVLEKPWTSPSHCLRTEAFMRDGGVVFERGYASRESRQRPMPPFSHAPCHALPRGPKSFGPNAKQLWKPFLRWREFGRMVARTRSAGPKGPPGG